MNFAIFRKIVIQSREIKTSSRPNCPFIILTASDSHFSVLIDWRIEISVSEVESSLSVFVSPSGFT